VPEHRGIEAGLAEALADLAMGDVRMGVRLGFDQEAEPLSAESW